MICNKCRGLGYLSLEEKINNRIYDYVIECECTIKFKAEAVKERLLRNLNLPESEYTKTFENYKVDLINQKVFNTVLEFSEAPNGKNLLLFSETSGNGKSHLSKAVLLANYDTRLCAYINIAKFLNDIKANNFLDIKEKKKALILSDLLILDDLSMSTPADWKQELYYEVLEDRFNNNSSTIISANISNPLELSTFMGLPAFDRFISRSTNVDCSNIPGRRHNV